MFLQKVNTLDCALFVLLLFVLFRRVGDGVIVDYGSWKCEQNFVGCILEFPFNVHGLQGRQKEKKNLFLFFSVKNNQMTILDAFQWSFQ